MTTYRRVTAHVTAETHPCLMSTSDECAGVVDDHASSKEAADRASYINVSEFVIDSKTIPTRRDITCRSFATNPN